MSHCHLLVEMFLLKNIELPAPKHICMRLTILTGSKNSYNIKVAETLKWPVGSRHAPLGLQIYYFIISENADHIDYL